MKALLLSEYKTLSVVDMPVPAIAEDEALVRVKACGVCGSDIHGYDGSTGRRIPPLVMGHEAAGVIERVGSRVERFAGGDRVTFFEDGLARAIRENAACAPATKTGGTVSFVLETDFRRKKYNLYPGKSSSLPSSVRRRGETKIVTRRKPESSWTPLGSSVSVPDSVGIGSIPR